jgi:RecA/RadA recombinase
MLFSPHTHWGVDDMNIKRMISELGDASLSVMQDREGSAEFSTWYSTGSHSLNALISGSIFGGIQGNKITEFAGDSGTGKTFLSLSACRDFLDKNKDAFVLYIDTEDAVTADMAEAIGVDTSRVLIKRVRFVEEFKSIAVKVLRAYESEDEDNRAPFMIVLDSIGALLTKREFEEDAEDMKSDMGRRAKAIGNSLMVINAYLGRLNVPFIIVNHVYANVSGYGPAKKAGGGSKIEYFSSTIVYLSKSKKTEGTGSAKKQTGILVTGEIQKGRFTKPGMKVECLIDFVTGIDRYYGLVDIAVEVGLFQKTARHIVLPDGKKMFETAIYRNPEEVFTPDILAQLDKASNANFRLGKVSEWEEPTSNT